MSEGNRTGLINIDLSGEPLTKLIEVSSKGMGNLLEPWMIRRRAKAAAFEMDTLKSAMDRNGINGGISISRNGLEIKVEEGTVEERALISMVQKEVKKQMNTEKIVANAAINLKSVEVVSSEPVEDEWITRFFSIAQDITDEDMQTIWSKILSDEIVKPKSYSLRSLELLRNMSKQEAELFAKFIKSSLDTGTYRMFIDSDEIKSHCNINFNDVLLLEEIGLVNRDLTRYIGPKNREAFSIDGENLIDIENINEENKYSINMVMTTKVGYELSKIIKVNVDEDLRRKITSHIIQKGEGNLIVRKGIRPVWNNNRLIRWSVLTEEV